MTEAPSVLLSNSSSRAPSQAPTTLSNRPESSQSIRPDSSMSTRGHSIPPIAVKKTRAANPARSDAAKLARGATRTTAARNSSQKVNEAPTTKRASSSSRSTNGITASNSAASTVPTSDIDSLTSGMKKIKINLTTKAQREAKAAQALKTATAATENTTDENPLPISASGDSMHAPVNPRTPEKSSAHPATLLPKSERPPATPEPLTPQPSVFARIQQLQVASSVPLPASPPRASTTTTIASPRAELNNMFIPYQPEGPTHTAAPRQEALKWLEPNTSTPARSPAKRTVADLPVFSATGVIPFGVNSGGSKKEDTKIETSIWDVPETPGR
jgi:histone deacetylase HOS3